MSDSLKPLTKTQLAEIASAYLAFCPGWTLCPPDRIVRTSGPLLQQIGFQSLSYPAYRPSACIRLTAFPEVRSTPQFLDSKYDVVIKNRHETMLPSVAEAMIRTFRPSILAPLDPAEVATVLVEQTPGGADDLVVASAISAYFQRDADAAAILDKAETVLGQEHLVVRRTLLMPIIKKLRSAISNQTAVSLLGISC